MKRAGLVLACNASSLPWGSSVKWCVRRSWMSATKRVKTDGLDAKALCLKLDRFVPGNRAALALVRIPTPEKGCLLVRRLDGVRAHVPLPK